MQVAVWADFNPCSKSFPPSQNALEGSEALGTVGAATEGVRAESYTIHPV